MYTWTDKDIVMGEWRIVFQFCILATFKLSGWVPTCDSVHSCQSWWLYSAAPSGRPDSKHHDCSHTVTLYWNWTNQSLPYPSASLQVSIFEVIDLIWWGFESPELPKRDTEPTRSDRNQFCKSLVLTQPRVEPTTFQTGNYSVLLPIRPPPLVGREGCAMLFCAAFTQRAGNEVFQTNRLPYLERQSNPLFCHSGKVLLLLNYIESLM